MGKDTPKQASFRGHHLNLRGCAIPFFPGAVQRYQISGIVCAERTLWQRYSRPLRVV